MLDLSVIICTHNPRPTYLHRVLAALRNQTLPKEQWEFLLIDNASDARLDSVWDISWHPNARHIFEGELGVAYARRRGMIEMNANLLVFVDDDNVLAADYLSEALKLSGEWPELGTWGSGNTEPEFEIEPKTELEVFFPYLALRTADKPHWSNVCTCTWATPWGAGMCVRANVAHAYCKMAAQSRIDLSSRVGKALLSCEDVELSYVACQLGMGMGIFPSLKLTHLIPKERLTEKYLVKLFEGTLTSLHLLAYKWRGIVPRNPLSVLGILDVIANFFLLQGLQRHMFIAQKRSAYNARKMIRAAANDLK